MLSINFYGGIGQIGGNKILLQDGDTSLFMDFGTPYSVRGDFFEEFLNPRPGAGLLDLLELGLLPPLKGIYRPDLVIPEVVQRFSSAPKRSVDGVLVSHAHLDHCGYVSFLRKEIPIYASALTGFIVKAMQDCGGTDFEREICYLSERVRENNYLKTEGPYQQRCFVFVDGFPSGKAAEEFWNWSPAKTKKMVCYSNSISMDRIGELPVRYFPVDHSVFGANAYAISTSKGWVAYSGDLRLHGKNGWKTQKAAEEINKLKPYIYIGEGTRVTETAQTTEEDVYENALRATRNTSGKLVIADFGPRNIERLLTFHRIAQDTHRQLVVLAKDAYLLDKMSLASGQVISLEKQSDILIYEDRHFRRANWEESIWDRFTDRKVTPAMIGNSPGEFILCFSFWDINDLIDIAPRGGTYIYSSSEAYDEEQRMDMRRLNNWIKHFEIKGVGLPREELNWQVPEGEWGFHASGHASGPDLVEIIKIIEPKIFIPVHTEKPEYFVEALRHTNIEVRVPVLDKEMTFK